MAMSGSVGVSDGDLDGREFKSGDGARDFALNPGYGMNGRRRVAISPRPTSASLSRTSSAVSGGRLSPAALRRITAARSSG